MTAPSESRADHELRIRFGGDADIARLVEMINAAFVVESFIEGTRTDAARLAEQRKKGAILLAEKGDGQLVASVYLEKRDVEKLEIEKRSPEKAGIAKRGQRGYLGMLAVAPAWQGRSLSRRMMREAEAWLRREECVGVDITVLSLRAELLPIYRHFGFVETGTLPFKPDQKLKEGYECHCIVMSKEL
jgi:GNAT superfamily N-acetyltransferase